MKLTKNEILDLINSMEFNEYDGDGECLYYVFVDDNEENREKIAKFIPNVDSFITEYADDDVHGVEVLQFDIQMAAWDYTDADYFDGCKFIISK